MITAAAARACVIHYRSSTSSPPVAVADKFVMRYRHAAATTSSRGAAAVCNKSCLYIRDAVQSEKNVCSYIIRFFVAVANPEGRQLAVRAGV